MNLALGFALASALFWGSGDFLGGLASRTTSSVTTTFMAQAAGLIGLLGVCAVTGPNPLAGSLRLADIGWGVVAGLSGVIGIGLFYEAMGRGPLGPVASVTSVMSSLVPVGAGFLFGERPSTRVLMGVGVAIIGIWLVAGQRRGAEEKAASGTTLVLAATAGVFFAGYLISLAQTTGESGLWPVAAGRTAATVAIGLVFLGTRIGNPTQPLGTGSSLKLSIGAGLLDAAANALYALAVRDGMLSVVAVVASMYPASTVLLARMFLAERLTRRRGAGMAVGIGAVGMIAFASTVAVVIPTPMPVPFDAPVSAEVPTSQGPAEVPTTTQGPPEQMPLVEFGIEEPQVNFESNGETEVLEIPVSEPSYTPPDSVNFE